MKIAKFNFLQFVFMVGVLSLLTSCATLKEMICDCQPAAKKESTKESKVTSKASRSSSPVEETPVPAVDEAEEMLGGEIYAAMDAFVFNKDEKRMLVFCKSTQVQCWLNDKRWPIGKKLDRKKLKKSPFMTGSKMGLRGDERVQIRWEFFKKKN